MPESLIETETMNPNALAIENQDLLTVCEAARDNSEDTSEITPMTMDCFKLVGGGSSIVLLG